MVFITQTVLFTVMIFYLLYVWYKRCIKLFQTINLIYENKNNKEDVKIYTKVMFVTIKEFAFDLLVAFGTLVLIPGGTIIGLTIMIIMNFLTTVFYKKFNETCNKNAKKEVEKELKYYKKFKK